MANRGIEAVRVLQGLLSLTKKHPSNVVEKACETAESYQEYRLATIRKLIKHSAPKQEAFEFLDQHPIIRNLADYGDVIRVDFNQGRRG